MIVLGATTQSLEAVLAGAVTTTQPRVLVCYRDIQTVSGSSYTPASTVTATNNTTQVTICAAPAANHQIVIDTINVYNVDTASITISIIFDVSGTDTILWRGTLAPGQTLTYNEGAGWQLPLPNSGGLISTSDQNYLTAARLGIFNVMDATYGAKGDSTTDDSGAINLAIAAAVAYQAGLPSGGSGQRGAIVYFPPGIFRLNSVLTPPNANGITFQGCGAATTLYINTATGDILSGVTGKSFLTIRDLQFFNLATRTAGAYINTNGCNDVHIENVVMTGAFQGIAVTGSSIKVDICDVDINQTVATTGVSIYINNGLAGDTYIYGKCVMSNSAGARPLAGVRVQQSGHFSIDGLNCTNTINGLLIDPATSQDVSYGFVTNSLFDSGGTNGLKVNPANSASARVRSLKFVNAWFAGYASGAGAEISSQGSSAVVDDIEFTNCRFLNNSTHGLSILFGSNIKVTGGTISGNSVGTSNTSDGIFIASGINDFMITGVTSGAAGTGINTQRYGLSINGTSNNRFIVADNDFSDNLTGAVLNSSTAAIQVVSGNVGTIITPAATGPATLLSGAGTEVYVTPAFAIPANSLTVGQGFRWTIYCSNAAVASTNTIRLKFGTLGTTGDANIINQALGAGTAATGGAKIVIEAVVKSVGSGSTNIYANMTVWQTGTTGFTNAAVQSFNAAATTLNSTVANFMGVAISPSVANSVTVQQTFTEMIATR